MLEVIEKLLILQDRDRKIVRSTEELVRMKAERKDLQSRAEAVQATLETAKNQGKQTESERKKIELDVDAKRQLIEKYSLQQFQTKKNEEYRTLAHEIETCKEAIIKLEDHEIELMEQAEAIQKKIAETTREANEAKKTIDEQLQALAQRETNLKTELADLQGTRSQITASIDESALSRYERLLKNKGTNIIMGIQHSVCGGCHMKLPAQVLITCQTQKEIVGCPNCGRILYYSRDMDLSAAD